MEKIIISAVAQNGVIGNNDEIPWYIPEDFKRFKEITMGCPAIMGRKTYLSIVKRLGKPLPGRSTIVLSKDNNYQISHPDVSIARSIDDAFFLAAEKGDKTFVMGGHGVYCSTINNVDRLEITEVHKDFLGDTFFPEIDKRVWRESNRERKISKTGLEYSFVTYLRQ